MSRKSSFDFYVDYQNFPKTGGITLKEVLTSAALSNAVAIAIIFELREASRLRACSPPLS